MISGNIGIMAYAFADYAVRIWPIAGNFAVWLAVAAIVLLSLLNMFGVVAGKIGQNVLSVLKVAGLVGVVVAGVWAAITAPSTTSAAAAPTEPNFGLALVFVLYAFGGWSHAAYVAAEVRDERRNLPARSCWEFSA